LILLDTNALLRLVWSDPLARAAAQRIAQASLDRDLAISAITAWELGLLATRTSGTGRRLGDARLWFEAARARLGFAVVPLSEAIAFEAAYLPGAFYRDPSDRMIVATARVGGGLVVTADRAILAYAEAGHVRAVAC